MGLRADWFTDLTSPEDSDPFADNHMSQSPVISIESTEAELRDRMQELLGREARLDEMEITCPIKDMPDVSCLACPVCKLGSDSPLSALCRVGQEQERVLTTLAAKVHGV